MKCLVIVPAYNEEKNILKTVNSVKSTKVKGVTIDYIVINDGSKDFTKQVLTDNKLKFIDLPFNLGIGGAVQTGYKYAYYNNYDFAIQFDGDGQHDPKYLEMMFDELCDKELDMVIGSRFIEKKGFQSSSMRRVGIRFFSLLIKVLTGHTITDPTSGLRMVGRNVMEIFSRDYPRDYPEPESVVAVLRRNMKVEEIPVIMHERGGGVSSISLNKSVYYMIKVTLAILIERIRKY